MTKRKILFVDDQANVLAGLRRMLRDWSAEWDMEFVESGEEALRRFAAAPYHVVVTDIRMPGIDGIQLLTEIMRLYPQTIRIVLSGQCDCETALRSVGPAHQFLSKPCEAATLRSAILRACALHERMLNPDLRKLIAGISNLPTIPSLHMRIVEELRSPNVSVRTVGNLVSKDVAMSAKILQLVNSSFFGLPRQLANPIEAVSLLGIDTIASLVLSFGVFSNYASGATAKHVDGLANHSLQVATLARDVVKQQRGSRQQCNDAFLAGLMHDVGKLVLLSSFPREYSSILLNDSFPDVAAGERANFGATHGDVGAYLLAIWGLPDAIVEVSAYHHSPGECYSRSFGALTAVHVANGLLCEDAISNPAAIDRDYLASVGVVEHLSSWRKLADTVAVHEQVAAV